jgi:hypothetical protein
MVSTPVRWEEVEEALRAGDASALSFDAAEAFRRFEHDGDLFAPVLKLRQRLPALAGVTLRAGRGARLTAGGRTGAGSPRGRPGARSPGRRRSGTGGGTPPPGGGHRAPHDGYLSS